MCFGRTQCDTAMAVLRTTRTIFDNIHMSEVGTATVEVHSQFIHLHSVVRCCAIRTLFLEVDSFICDRTKLFIGRIFNRNSTICIRTSSTNLECASSDIVRTKIQLSVVKNDALLIVSTNKRIK